MAVSSAFFSPGRLLPAMTAGVFLALAGGMAGTLRAQTAGPAFSAILSPFAQSLALAAADDSALADFYAERGYAPLWTGAADSARRQAFLSIILRAGDHGLAVQRYDAQALAAAFGAARSEGDRGRLEARMTRAFLDYVRDMDTGVIAPARVDPTIVREIVRIPESDALEALASSGDLAAWLGNLVPDDPGYALLIKAKFDLEAAIARGGWGPGLSGPMLRPGATGAGVVALRDRLQAMGYLGRSAAASYDDSITRAVQRFQIAHGLEADGILTETTLAELNIAPQERLKSVIVALERSRWLDIDRRQRHVWVNLPDYSARIIEDGKESFMTRTVIGKPAPAQRTPEFSDEIQYMVINPSWSVPRSIVTGEYLPLLQKNPNAVGHLKILDRNGRVVDRSKINFRQYNTRSFPYSMRQPPSDDNALGLVKFMFPNQWNIYLHDTPSKSLFDRETRAFSHGCIRLARPFDFAYALLGVQSEDPEGQFRQVLDGGREQSIRLQRTLPVHLVYFTAFPDARGGMNYRRDVYGRDAAIFEALVAAGVVLGGRQG